MQKARAGSELRRLQLTLGLFFLALAVPTAILVRQAYQQLKWESFHQHSVLAEELAVRIDSRLRQMVDAEEARSLSDYGFLVLAGDPAANFVQRSPLSDYPVRSAIPGMVGYFQLDPDGLFSTPLLPPPTEAPAVYGITPEELARRLALQTQVRDILSQNRLVPGRGHTAATDWSPGDQRDDPEGNDRTADPKPLAPDSPIPPDAQLPANPDQPSTLSQSAFDELSEPPIEPDPGVDEDPGIPPEPFEGHKSAARYLPDPSRPGARPYPVRRPQIERRAGRKERSILLELQSRRLNQARTLPTPVQSQIHVTIFESEIDPFEFYRVDSGHFVLFRKVWRDGQRIIQGALIDSDLFLTGLVESEFRQTAVSRMSDLAVAHRDSILAEFNSDTGRGYLGGGGDEWRGDLLYRTRLSPPLSDLELIFTIERLPAGPGAAVVGWLGGILTVVLCGGFLLMYRLGIQQIGVVRQQQDFVSAVSHELKTPLTSIRMYGEMLREGWVPEEKRTSYYDFIYTESERLSRLIANVLQLARMTRGVLEVELKPVSVAELLDGVRSQVASQVELAGFELRVRCQPQTAGSIVRVDTDCFAQIVINLVDNALKFGAKSPTKAIEIAFTLQRDRSLVFSVRDFGPGVPGDRAKKIFRLFYRVENEMTRETVGTGIGLALVHQIAQAMNARIDVINRDPGAEFQVVFPIAAEDRQNPEGLEDEIHANRGRQHD